MNKQVATTSGNSLMVRKKAKKNRPDKRSRQQTGYVTKRSMDGGRINVPDNPPATVQNPWTPIVAHFLWRFGIDNATGLINVGDLTSRVKYQLDSEDKIFKSFEVLVRIHEIRLWNMTGRSVGLAVWDYSADSQDEDELGSWVDAGNTNGFPHLGYKWPLSLRQNSLSNVADNQNRRIATIVSGTQEEVLVHVHMDFRFKTTMKSSLSGLNALYEITKRLGDLEATQREIATNQAAVVDWLPGRTPSIFGMAANVMVIDPIPLGTQQPSNAGSDVNDDTPSTGSNAFEKVSNI